MGIATTLSIAAQSLKNQQAGIQSTGHNLANVATPGFSRQRAVIETETPAFEGGVLYGQGAKVTAVQRVVDRFIEAELLSVNRDIGRAEAEHQALAAIQQAFPTTGGIDGALSAFFGALSDLSNNPSGLAERLSLVGKANALGDSFRQARDLLVAAQRNLDEELSSITSRVSVLAGQVASLNNQIKFTESGGVAANDFRDQRQTLLQELTRLTGAAVREEADGQVTVIASGLALVSGDRAASLNTNTIGGTGARSVTYQSPEGLTFDATAFLNGGKIGGVIDMRDNRLPGIIDRLDQIAYTLVNEVNAQHALGFDASGNAGGNFFNAISVVAGAAQLIRVDSTVAADPRLIAAASAAATVPGDNRNALALVNLRNTTHAGLGGLTLQDSFLALVGDVGTQVEGAQTSLQFRQSLLAQTQARRESASGVNMDEEMTKLILFQRAFEASSMLVRTADELFDTIINMLR